MQENGLASEYLTTLRANKAALVAELEVGKQNAANYTTRCLNEVTEIDKNQEESLKFELKDLVDSSILQLRVAKEYLSKHIRDHETNITKQKQRLNDLYELSKGLDGDDSEHDMGDSALNDESSSFKNKKLLLKERNNALSSKLYQVLCEEFEETDRSFWEAFVNMPDSLIVNKSALSERGLVWLLLRGICSEDEEPELKYLNRAKLDFHY